ncbi:MAG: hypothetical protein Q4B67_02415 [Eubacteriales bacterium]|nr:hypothetical protein [Eubacteriales bacterium]
MIIAVTGFAGDSNAKNIYLDIEKQKKLLDRYPQSFFGVYRGPDEPSLLIEKAFDFEECADDGVLGALWRLLKRNNLGGEYSQRAIPVRQQCIEISEFFGINPYQAPSYGCTVWLLKDMDDRAAVIGHTAKGPAIKRTDAEVISYLRRPGT